MGTLLPVHTRIIVDYTFHYYYREHGGMLVITTRVYVRIVICNVDMSTVVYSVRSAEHVSTYILFRACDLHRDTSRSKLVNGKMISYICHVYCL